MNSNIYKYFLIAITFLFLASFTNTHNNNSNFDYYFENQSLRVDFELVGNKIQEKVILKEIKKTPFWAGSKNISSFDSLNLGNYRFNVYDSLNNKLLYCKGFNSLFEEWLMEPEAKNIERSFYQVCLLPFPKNTIKFQIQKRLFETGEFSNLFEYYINPKKGNIKNEKPLNNNYKLIYGNKKMHNRIDIAFIADGYTKNQTSKFRKDVINMWEYISSIPPFDKHKDKFNIYAVESISQDTACDMPQQNYFANTALDFGFGTFGSDRYLTTDNIKAINDIAEIVPYDQIFVLVNTSKYGGGGFFNHYAVSSAHNELSQKVAIHEFGHSFAGLADEYYYKHELSDPYYNLNTEPWEPNITTLVNFDKKWPHLVESTTPIPTKRIPEFNYKVGVYEGGGYASKGIYSPYQNCRMKSNTPRGFCPVCSKAIERVINWHCQQ